MEDDSGRIIAGVGCCLAMIGLGAGLPLLGVCLALGLLFTIWSRYGR